MEQRIVCQRCVYYFVTWEPNKPHGCKAYGFKSRLLPSVAVKNSSGTDCNFYTPKFVKQ
jgi:hypothetical protein